MTLGVDVGGTFTDLAVWDGHELRIGKTSTTPDQSEGVIAGARQLLGDAEVVAFLHGTTVATNALLERRGARTALVTDTGFRDLVEIGRQDRPSLYDSSVDRAIPLIERSGRFEITFADDAADPADPSAIHDTSAHRDTAASGDTAIHRATSVSGDTAIDRGTSPHRDTSVPDDGAGFATLLQQLRAYQPDAVAICLLYGYAHPERERRLAAAIADHLDVAVSCSHAVSGEFREFERLSTTILNAYLTPVVEHYLRNLRSRGAEAGLPEHIEVMRSSGGLMSVEAACDLPAAVLLSGPAGGVVASAELGRSLGLDHLVSFDMGGTSTDVCRIDDGRPEVAYERDVAGLPCRLPSVAVHTVGAGGGSIAWVDDGGALRVGPQSAGAHPGPACYGRGGTDATVTDANLVLGRLDPAGQLAGSVDLDAEAARDAIGAIGERVGLGLVETALGILRIAEEHMAQAIRVVSVEEGSDPREATLVSFGGAGGLHATALARTLEMAGVVVPPYAGVFSAFGLLLSPRRTDRARSATLSLDDLTGLARVAEEVAEEARAELAGRDGGDPSEIDVAVRLDVRYLGQAHETPVPYRADDDATSLTRRFHEAHRQRNGFARPGDPIEIVTIRAEATAPPALTWDQLPQIASEGEARRGERQVTTADGDVTAEVWWRPGLAPDDQITGPAIIEEREATTYLAPGERARVLPSGALQITW